LTSPGKKRTKQERFFIVPYVVEMGTKPLRKQKRDIKNNHNYVEKQRILVYIETRILYFQNL